MRAVPQLPARRLESATGPNLLSLVSRAHVFRVQGGTVEFGLVANTFLRGSAAAAAGAAVSATAAAAAAAGMIASLARARGKTR